MAAPPFVIEIFDNALNFKGTIGNPLSVTIAVRHNIKGLSTILMSDDHPRTSDVIADGSICRIRTTSGEHLTSGRIQAVNGAGPKKQGSVTFTVHDAFELFHNTLGWPIPTAAISAQGTGDGYDRHAAGPAETIVKYYVTRNAVTRLGLPVVVATDLGRGSTVGPTSLRFHTLYDRLWPVVDGHGVDRAGLGWTVKLDSVQKKWVVDCYVPRVYPRVLTEESGVITDYTWQRDAPVATHVVVGGQDVTPDVLTTRVFRNVVDAPRAAAWGVKEVFRNATDVEAADVTTLVARGQETLDEGRPTTGIGLTLSQTGIFTYGNAIRVGDTAPWALSNGAGGTDTLSEATLSWTRENGYKATPTIGEAVTGSYATMAKAIARYAREQRNRYLGG